MNVVARLFVTMFCFVATFYFVYWVPFSIILPDGVWLPFVGSLAVAVLVGRFVWRRLVMVPGGLASSVVLGAVVVGGVAFLAGFFGPMILDPGANQGPLLGLFITGPVGFVVGAIGGAVRWWIRSSRQSSSPTRAK